MLLGSVASFGFKVLLLVTDATSDLMSPVCVTTAAQILFLNSLEVPFDWETLKGSKPE